MDDLSPIYLSLPLTLSVVTKEDKIDEVMVNAVNKAKEVIEELNYNELPLEETVEPEGETVDVKRPKKNPAEEKVEELEGIRPAFGKE